MTIPVTSLSSPLTVTNLTATTLVIVDLTFLPGVPRTLTIAAMQSPYVVDVWNGIHANRLIGNVSTSPVTSDYTTDPAAGGGGGGGGGDMLAANNLSDLTNKATARTNLGAGAANGLATLDATSKIPTSQLPAAAITNTWPVASQAAMLALAADVGDVAIRSDVSKSYILQNLPPSTLGNWLELLNPGDTSLQQSANLSDVSNAATARTNIGAASLATVIALG